MANVFEKGTKFAGTAMALLKRTIKAPALFVYSYGKADFSGALGDVVNVKRPPVLKATDKGWRNDTAIAVSNINQSKIQIPLNQFPVQAVHLSPEEETLDEVDYVRDVQAPQVQAMGEFYENSIIAALAGAEFVFEVSFNTAATDGTQDPRKVATAARKYAQDAHLPSTGRYWIVGSSVSAAIAGFDKLLEVDTSGLPEALRDGVVGKLGGWVIVELDALDENESYFVHETAIAKANVAPVVPRGAIGGASISANGMAITQIWDYDALAAKDRSIVESFIGATPVLDPKIADGEIVLDGSGNAIMQFVRGIRVVFGTVPSTDSATWTTALSGVPTGGTYTLTVDGDATGNIAFNATNSDIADALNALESVDGAKVTGTTTKTLKFNEFVVVALGTNALTGGTTPSVTVTKV